ncbi:MAG: hypothetical protein NTX61_18470 [Bacteroidetes bacterium]|nr:hypothetical protein [Bacteroidota bacterium]
MLPDKQTAEIPQISAPSRPLFLTVICLFAFVFFGIIAILFLLSVFWSGRITEVINQYMLQEKYAHFQIILITLGGFIFHAVAFAGIILIWNLKRTGYILFAIPVLLISGYQLFNHNIPVSSVAVYIALLILFGLFFRKLR